MVSSRSASGFASNTSAEHAAIDLIQKMGPEDGSVLTIYYGAGATAQTAEEVADQIMFMEGGQIVETGTPEHFFTNPTEERTKLFLSQIL